MTSSWRKSKQTAAQRGYGAAWRRARARFLQDHPLCVMCLAEGKLTAATVVDHIKPHRGDQKLFWDVSNWQPLCKEHHDSTKKILESGGRPPATFDDEGKVKWSHCPPGGVKSSRPSVRDRTLAFEKK